MKIYNLGSNLVIDLESWLTIHYPDVLLEYETAQESIYETGEEDF